LNDKTVKLIRERTAEELEESRIRELCEEIKVKVCSRYGLSDFSSKHWMKIAERDDLREAFIDQMLSIETKDKLDVGGFLLVIQAHKVSSLNE
jgi:hypothetical protein